MEGKNPRKGYGDICVGSVHPSVGCVNHGVANVNIGVECIKPKIGCVNAGEEGVYPSLGVSTLVWEELCRMCKPGVSIVNASVGTIKFSVGCILPGVGCVNPGVGSAYPTVWCVNPGVDKSGTVDVSVIESGGVLGLGGVEEDCVGGVQ